MSKRGYTDVMWYTAKRGLHRFTDLSRAETWATGHVRKGQTYEIYQGTGKYFVATKRIGAKLKAAGFSYIKSVSK